MCVCVYVCMRVCMYVYVCMCMYVCIYIYHCVSPYPIWGTLFSDKPGCWCPWNSVRSVGTWAWRNVLSIAPEGTRWIATYFWSGRNHKKKSAESKRESGQKNEMGYDYIDSIWSMLSSPFHKWIFHDIPHCSSLNHSNHRSPKFCQMHTIIITPFGHQFCCIATSSQQLPPLEGCCGTVLHTSPVFRCRKLKGRGMGRLANKQWQ